MAATATTTTTKLIQLRPIYRPSTTGSISIQFFSSSSSTPDPNGDTPQPNSDSPPPPRPKSPPSYPSSFDDVKARFRHQQGNPQSQPPSFSSSFRTSNAPSPKIRNSEEILKNLAEFRSRSAVPPPPPDGSATQPPGHFSFAEMYRRNVASSGEESSSAGSKYPGRIPMKDIAESLKNLKATAARNQNERSGKNYDKMSLERFKETLKMEPGDQSGRDSTRQIGGSDIPRSIFGKEMGEKDGGRANADTTEEFVRMYNHTDLGERLKSLRPDKKGDWFSLQELNERLKTLRVIDKKEASSRGDVFNILRDSLQVMDKVEKPKKMQTVDWFTRLGRTPSYMLAPPQDHLVEKYFHPDNMSASEKLKLELKKVRDEFKMSESDCGSARVQVAQLTTKIKHLSMVLHKKDKHSKKGLQGMVQKRKTLLKYLRRTDWESYCFVLSKLGLRDNPDYKN